MSSPSEEDAKRLRVLEECAYRFMKDPLEKAFYHLECIVEGRMDLRASVKALAIALIELKRSMK